MLGKHKVLSPLIPCHLYLIILYCNTFVTFLPCSLEMLNKVFFFRSRELEGTAGVMLKQEVIILQFLINSLSRCQNKLFFFS